MRMISVLFQAIGDGLGSSLTGLMKIAVIVFPLMVIMEIARDTGVMQRITRWFYPVAKPLRMSNEAVFPLLIGLVFGLSYGSGVIINAAKQGELSRRDRYAVGIFLSICHSLFEDTFILVAVGANLIWLLTSRLVLAIAVTMLITRMVLAGGLLRRFRSSDLSSHQL